MASRGRGGRARWIAARAVLTVSAAYGGVGSYLADWNASHIHNPRWPPHAKFHNAQSMSLGAALLLIAVALLWGPGRRSAGRFGLAAAVSATYPATQLSALLYPGTGLTDDPDAESPPQAAIAAVLLVLDALALILGRSASTSG